MKDQKLQENHKENIQTSNPVSNKEEKKKIVIPSKKETPKKTIFFFLVSVIFLGVSFFFYNKYVLNADKIPVKKITYSKEFQETIKKKNVTIYIPKDNLTGFIPKEIEITDGSFHSEINTIFLNLKSYSNYLIKGEDDQYYQFIDSSVTLLDSYLVDDKLYLNLNPSITDHIHSKKQELYFLYTLVNTFTNIPGINEVKFLIDGEEVDKLKWYSLKNFYNQNLNL